MDNRAKYRMKVFKIKVMDLNAEHVEQMWSLYSQCYGNVERSLFEQDLKEKDCVFYGVNRNNGSFAGFTTAKFYTVEINGQKAGIFYSGDTIFLPEYWGQFILRWTVAKEVLAFKLRTFGTPLYWFLVVMGYRTYLSMARNFKNYWPTYKEDTPKEVEAMLAIISRQRFGLSYSEKTGLIKPSTGLVYLKEAVAPITQDILDISLEVSFLLKKNPEYAHGVEMPCLGRFDLGFLKIFAVKAARAWFKRMGSSLRSKLRSKPKISGSYAN